MGRGSARVVDARVRVGVLSTLVTRSIIIAHPRSTARLHTTRTSAGTLRATNGTAPRPVHR